jgi:hypothetical protein
MHLTKTFVVLFLFAAMAVVPWASAATCSNASIKGVYGSLHSGSNAIGPVAGISRLAVDGAGNITGWASKSINGTIYTYDFTGTYQINKDCTGNLTVTNQDGNNVHDNIYLNNGNKGAFEIQTDAQTVVTIVVIAQGTAVCTNPGVKHTYSIELTGTALSVGQVAGAGRLTLNGAGAITGSMTVSLAGNIGNALPVTGTYSIKSDCTGTAQITPQGLDPINLGLFIVNSDKQILAVETDTNTIVSGMFEE